MESLKRWKEDVVMKACMLLAACGLFSASAAANSACMFPFYEPEQPEELEMFVKRKM